MLVILALFVTGIFAMLAVAIWGGAVSSTFKGISVYYYGRFSVGGGLTVGAVLMVLAWIMCGVTYCYTPSIILSSSVPNANAGVTMGMAPPTTNNTPFVSQQQTVEATG